MKYRFFLGIVFALCLSSCTGFFDKDDESFTGNEEQPSTYIKFDNSNNAVSVSVYSSSERQDDNLIGEIDGGEITDSYEWTPSPDGYFFYLTFHLRLPGPSDTIPYTPGKTKDFVEAGIPEGETTTVKIPTLDQVVQPDEALFEETHIIITNSGSSALRLVRNTSFITPINRASVIVNSGDTVVYRVPSAADISGYKIQLGNISDYPLPADLSSFQKGYLYTLNFNGSAVVATAPGKLLTLNNL